MSEFHYWSSCFLCPLFPLWPLTCNPSPRQGPDPGNVRPLSWTHHDRFGQAVLRRAEEAQRTAEELSLGVGQRRRGQRQAVQLWAGASPEGPVNQRPLSLEGLLLTMFCRDTVEEEVGTEVCGMHRCVCVCVRERESLCTLRGAPSPCRPVVFTHQSVGFSRMFPVM